MLPMQLCDALIMLKNKNAKKRGRYNGKGNCLHITPTWQAVVGVLCLTLKNTNDQKAIYFAEQELTKMAKLADLYVEQEN